MRKILPTALTVLASIILSLFAVFPIEKNLRLGKDLRGGATLVYTVQIDASENAADVMERTKDALRRRVDPDGLMEISMVAQGRDRLEISMPLPSDEVKAAKKKFEEALVQLGRAQVTESRLDAIMAMPADQREHEVQILAAGSSRRLDLLHATASAFEAAQQARAALDAAPQKTDELVAAAAAAQIKYEETRAALMRTALTAEEIRRVVSASTRARTIEDQGQIVLMPSPRELAEKKLREVHPEAAEDIDRILGLYNDYAKVRTTLDDPQDLVRMLKGAGVLSFRIVATTSGNMAHPQETRLREELRALGPKTVRSTDARWFKINQIENWVHTKQQAEAIAANENAASQVFGGMGYVVEPYAGDFYMLCWDTRTTRLTQAEGRNWGVARAYPGADALGKPAIHFAMNPAGAVALGGLTKDHVGDSMAILLDDEVYTAPRLKDALSSGGIIEGDFSQEEIRYVVRVLSGGSLQAKLSPEPIGIDSVGPQLGADNLRKGLQSGLVALLLVAAFMVVYYFESGVIAVVALVINSILILGCMAASKAAFTMPGIAGVVLTFGQAVDSNVLIYERMREEFQRGADMKTAVRQGFSRAMAPIMDGNISNLIICVVLYYFGTQEIRGFAVTLGIGVVTTLFTSTVVSRLIFTIFMDFFGWKKTSQLPMAFPVVQRMLSPHVDWMRYRNVFLGGLVIFLAVSGVFVAMRGSEMLGTEFRGGTSVELKFKSDQAGNPLTLTRQEVQDRLKVLAASGDSNLKVLAEAEILPINPAADGVTSDRFRIRTAPAESPQGILAAIGRQFEDVTESSPALGFSGANTTDPSRHAFPILTRQLSENVDHAGAKGDVSAYLGGAAVVIENIEPRPTRDALLARLERMRQQPDFAETLSRKRELRVIEGTDQEVKTALLLVRDDAISAIEAPERWQADVATKEWKLVNESLARASQLASLQDFSPTIAATFATNAILTITISLLALTIYVWIRFGAARWAIAATVPLFADVIGIAGVIGLSEILYNSPSTGGFARAIGLLPFKFDLAQIAALLTIIGYSLNDKIVILDRIRENKGRLPFASYQCINDSINQTMTRTLITAGAHLITTIILYLYGGEAVRGFALTFNFGVVLGTYTSIVSSPLVWSRAQDREFAAMGSGRPSPA